MDQEYMDAMGTAFLSELTEIQKEAMDKEAIAGGLLRGAARFLTSGAKKIGKAVSKKTPMGMTGAGSMTSRVGGQGAVRAGGIGKHMKQIYGAGAKGGGTMGGVKALARSRYGQMAAIPALGVAGYSALS